MEPEEFFAVIAIGMVLGSFLTLLIQAYGRRSARKLAAAGATGDDAKRTIALLVGENERQTGQIDRLQERLAVLERITIDPATRTAREIDALRN